MSRAGEPSTAPPPALYTGGVYMKTIQCKCGWKGTEDDLVCGKIEEESRYCFCCPDCHRIYWDDEFTEVKG